MPYTPFGPWTNGSPPGMDQAFLSNLESFLQTVNSAATDSNISSSSGIPTVLGLIANGGIRTNPAAVTVNGTTGTATLYQFLTGTAKAALLSLNSYQNSSATEQTISFPVPFTGKAWVLTGNIQGGLKLTPYLGGSANLGNVRVFTTLGTGGGSGPVTSQINGFSIAQITNHFDALGLGVSETATTTDLIFIVGI